MFFLIRSLSLTSGASAGGLARSVKPLLVGLAALLGASAMADPLSSDFQELATASYTKLSANAGACSRNQSDWTIAKEVSAAELGCVLQLLQDNEAASELSDPAHYAELLLAKELRAPLVALLEQGSIQRQQRVSSQLQFELARHAFERGAWAQARALAKTLDNRYSLTTEQRQFLQLARALEKQHQRQHREAIKLYERFEPGNHYYAEARTNLAIAYLKQGWWTDAHRELEALLPIKRRGPGDEFANRLQMLLGFSQLQQGFYVDARERFRAISQDSGYVAYAWRGIGLSALYQQDYPGALNAFLQLRATNDSQLPEGPFLVAFTYDQMNSLALAQASYTEAVVTYQQQLDAVERDLLKLASSDWLPEAPVSTGDRPITTLGQPQAIETSSDWKEYQVLRELLSVLPSDGSFAAERTAAQELLRRYRHQLGERYSEQLELRREHLESYLSQSQYGLATIYDRQ